MNRRVIAGLLGLALALAGCSLERAVVSRGRPTIPPVDLDGSLPSIHDEINKENLQVAPGSLSAGHPTELRAPRRQVAAAVPTPSEQSVAPTAAASPPGPDGLDEAVAASPRPAPFAGQAPNEARPQAQAAAEPMEAPAQADHSGPATDAPATKAASVVDVEAIPTRADVSAPPEPAARDLPAELAPKAKEAGATPTPTPEPTTPVVLPVESAPVETTPPPLAVPEVSALPTPQSLVAPTIRRDPLLGPNPDIMPDSDDPPAPRAAPSPQSASPASVADAAPPVSATKPEPEPASAPAPVAASPQRPVMVPVPASPSQPQAGYVPAAPAAPNTVPVATFGTFQPQPPAAVAPNAQQPETSSNPPAGAAVPDPLDAVPRPQSTPTIPNVFSAPTTRATASPQDVANVADLIATGAPLAGRDPVLGSNPDVMPSDLTGGAPLASPRPQAGEPPPVGRMPSNLRPTTGKEPAAVPTAAPPRREIRVQRPASLSPGGGQRAPRDPLLGPTPDVMPQEPPTVYQPRLRPDAGAPPTVLEMTENRPGRDDAVIIPRPEPMAPNEPSADPLAVQAGFANSSPAVDLPRGPAAQSAAGVAPISTIPLLPPIFPPSSDRTFDPLPEMIANPATPASSRLEPSAVESRQALPTRAVQPHVIEIRRPPPAVAPSPGPAAAPARPLRGRDPLLGPNPDVMPPLGSNSAARRDPAVSRAAFELAIPKTPAPKPKPRPKPVAPPIDPMTAPEELPPLTDPEASRTSAENVRGLASVPVSAPQPLVLDSATTPTPITTQPPVAAAEDTAVRSDVSTRTQFTIGKPAARVGDEVITLYELRVGYMKRLDSMGMRGKKIPEDSSRVLLMNVLNDLIDRSLILQEAKRDLKDPKKYKMFMDVADKVWMDEELPPLLRKHAASNIHELKEKLDERGDSIEETRNQYRLEFLSKGYMEQKLGPKMKVELPEMREYYLTHLKKFDQVAQITWREVVVEVGKAASRAAARDKADALLARLRHGEDFAALAKAASDGPNRADGGLWKTSPGGYAVPAVNLALESLPIGQISGVLESPTSFHVVLVEARRRAGPATFAEVQDNVRRELRREKIMRESTTYLDKLRSRSVVWTAFGDPNVQRASAEGPAAHKTPKP